MPLQTRLSALISAIKGDFDGLDTRITALEGAGGGGTNSFYIWAEENGGISANAYEWSFGNGATGNDIGIPMMVAANLTHISINSDSPGTTAVLNARRQTTGSGTGSVVATTSALSNNGVYTLPTPVTFNVGDILIVQTGALVGTWTDVRACFRFEE